MPEAKQVATGAIATIRKAQSGYVAIIETMGTEEVSIVPGQDSKEAIVKAVEAMSAGLARTTSIKVAVEGLREQA